MNRFLFVLGLIFLSGCLTEGSVGTTEDSDIIPDDALPPEAMPPPPSDPCSACLVVVEAALTVCLAQEENSETCDELAREGWLECGVLCFDFDPEPESVCADCWLLASTELSTCLLSEPEPESCRDQFRSILEGCACEAVEECTRCAVGLEACGSLQACAYGLTRRVSGCASTCLQDPCTACTAHLTFTVDMCMQYAEQDCGFLRETLSIECNLVCESEGDCLTVCLLHQQSEFALCEAFQQSCEPELSDCEILCGSEPEPEPDCAPCMLTADFEYSQCQQLPGEQCAERHTEQIETCQQLCFDRPPSCAERTGAVLTLCLEAEAEACQSLAELIFEACQNSN